jgi:hypothetical protein
VRVRRRTHRLSGGRPGRYDTYGTLVPKQGQQMDSGALRDGRPPDSGLAPAGQRSATMLMR